MMISLFLVAAILPLTGLVGLYVEAARQARTYSTVPAAEQGAVSWAQSGALLAAHSERVRTWKTAALRDFSLIGGGLIAGVAASIWAVIDSAM